MAEPVSGASAYCTIGEFLDRYDRRIIADWLSDTGVKLTTDALNSSTRLTEILQDASGLVESACLVGEKYRPEDLAALTGNSKRFLMRLVADLAIGMIRGRRGYNEEEGVMPQHKAALEMLENIRNGERIFGLAEVMTAGNPTSEFITEQDLEQTNLSTFQARRFFGVRNNRTRT